MSQLPAGHALVHHLGRALEVANGCIERLMEQEGVRGLVPSHGAVLSVLFKSEPATMQQLAHACGRDPSTVTALVKKLKAQGYVNIQQSAEDGRRRCVTLTAEGRALAPKFERISARLTEMQSQGLSAAELDEAQRVLGIIEDNFREGIR